jgi:diketogulonate reductase-like aldo/keto reductase
MASSPTLSIKSALRLNTGHDIPLIGFGVFQNYAAKPSVLQALRAGYRCVEQILFNQHELTYHMKAMSILLKHTGTKLPSVLL